MRTDRISAQATEVKKASAGSEDGARGKEDVLPLRVHHLLCSVLYEGAGYSAQFTGHMNGIVSALKNRHTKLRLVTGSDSICARCPNRTGEGGCALDDAHKSVGGLDGLILERTGLKAGKVYTAEEAFMQAAGRMDESAFQQCCADCRWYLAGFCSYEKYERNVKNFFETEKTLENTEIV